MRMFYFVISFSLPLVLASSVAAGVFIDDFTALELDPRWNLDDQPESYDAGGGFSLDGTYARFNNVYQSGYAHIETAVDTTEGVRADAIFRTDNYYAVDWGFGVSIYFDAYNWTSIKLIGEIGEGLYDGWMASVMESGVLTSTFLQGEDKLYRFDCHIGGVELTDSAINFWATPLPVTPPNKYGNNGIASLIDSDTVQLLSVARPTGFTGDAVAIIGKGFTGTVNDVDYLEADFDNFGPPPIFEIGAFSGINLVRITTPGNDVLVGDYNGDNSVDAADYTVWRNNLGTTNLLQNDPIGGTIGTAQYDQWKLNFGPSGSGARSFGVVPEPCSAILAILAGVAFVARHATGGAIRRPLARFTSRLVA